MDKDDYESATSDDGDSGNTRHRILEAALLEFAEHGVAGARVDRIASRAEVNKALLYYYYQSKENLYRETLTTFLKDIVGVVRLRLESVQTLEDALTAVADHYRTVFLTRPQIPNLILRELANPSSELVPAWAEQIRASGVPALLRRFVEKEYAEGHLRELDLRQAVVSFITMQLGYYLMSPLIDRVLQIPDRKEFVMHRPSAVVDLFLHGVNAR